MENKRNKFQEFVNYTKEGINGIFALSMVCVATTMYSCSQISNVDDELKRMNRVYEENVIAGPQNERFFKDRQGNRVYLQIDGKPVESYFNDNNLANKVESEYNKR